MLNDSQLVVKLRVFNDFQFTGQLKYQPPVAVVEFDCVQQPAGFVFVPERVYLLYLESLGGIAALGFVAEYAV